MDAYELGQRIKARRKALGISQQELAESVGYTDKGMISRIEAGKISLPMDRMVEIANALSTPVSTFFDTTVVVEVSPSKRKLIESLDNLSDEQIAQVAQIVDIVMKGVDQWHPHTGTQNGDDGSSASARTEK